MHSSRITAGRMLLSPDVSGSGNAAAPKRKHWGRRIFILFLLVLIALVALVALAPTIASRIAPGKIAAAVNGSIKGSVKVGAVDVGWFSPTRIGPVEVFDPEGKPAAKVEVNTTTTLWRVVSERWWSMTNLDLGTIELAGDASIVRGPDGKSNLERAFEPRTPPAHDSKPAASKPASGSGGGGGIESIKGDLRITNFDLAYSEVDAAGKKIQDLGLRALKGSTRFDYQTASGGAVIANVDLQGAPTGAAATDPLKIKLDADIRHLSGSGAAWPLPDVKALKANVSNVPLALVDGILKMNGALVRDIGPRADLTADASINRQNVAAKLALVSDGAKANLNIATKDGAIVAVQATDPGSSSNTLTLRSTEFLDGLPGLREKIAEIAKQVRLDKAPGVTVSIENLRWPLPDAKADMSTFDLRGNGLTAKVRVSEMAGRIALNQPNVAPGSESPATQNMRPFTVAPLELAVNAADLAKPVTITGGTKATLDGVAAGDIALSATAAGLLDAQGHLRALSKAQGAGLADDLDAQVRVTGLSTALIQPIVAASGLALDTNADIGPTLDLALSAKADVKGVGAPPPNAAAGASSIPPVDFTANITSTNIRINGTGRMAQGAVSTTGAGLTVNIAQSAMLAQRIMTKPNQPAALELSGVGALAITIKDFSAPLDKLKGSDALAAVKALVSAEISNLGIKPVLAAVPVSTTAAATTPAQPVQIAKGTLTARLDGANPPRADLVAALSHENQPFDLTGTITLNGITGGKLPQSASGTSQLIAFKPTGKVELKNAPRSLANLVPAAAMVSTTPLTGDDMPTQIARAIRESIGRTITATLITQPDGATQKVVSSISTEAGGLSAETATTISTDKVVIDTITLGAGMKPETVNPVLSAASKPAAGASNTAPVQLAQPFRITAKSSGPITVPLKPGTFEPAWAGASDAAIAIAADNDIAIDNVPTGTDESGRPRTTGVRVKALKSDIKAPLSGLDPAQKSKRLAATFSANATRTEGNATIADISGTLAAAMDGSNPDADITLAQIDCAVVEGLIGKHGLLTGALGEKADAHARIAPKANAADTKEIIASITAPRLTEAKLNLEQSADRIALSAPSVITWKPDPAFVSNFVLGADAAAAAGRHPLRVTQAAPITLRLTQFAIATPHTDAATGQPAVGPLKPGVFMLDASIDAPSIALAIPTSTPAPSKPAAAGGGGLGGLLRNNNKPDAAPAAPTTTSVTLETITIAAKQELNAPELIANIGIARVKGDGASGDRPSSIKARVANLADSRGVIQSDKAVINLDADVAAFPTPIVDALANQGGLMTELLGPTINVQATARNIGLAEAQGAGNATGSIDVKAGSPRATATLKGVLKNGAFIQTGPINVSILEIRPDLINLLSGSVPVLTSLEKNPGDQPGTLDGTTLQIPINGDLKKLNGDLTIDPGVARFQTESIFGELISALGGKTGGSIGQKLQPFVVHMREGVLTYDKFDLPIGQFTISTRGTVDLVNRQVNVVTYAPLGSLSDKALGKLSTGIPGKLGVLDQMTQIPITTKGQMGATKTELDLGLFMKETGDRILKSPENLINTIGDILGGNKNKPKDAAPAPAPAQEPAPAPAPAAPKPKPPKKKK